MRFRLAKPNKAFKPTLLKSQQRGLTSALGHMSSGAVIKERTARQLWLLSLAVGWLGAPVAYQSVLKAKNFELLRGGGELIAAVALSGVLVALANIVFLLLIRAACKMLLPHWERSPLYLVFAALGFLAPAVFSLAMLAIELASVD